MPYPLRGFLLPYFFYENLCYNFGLFLLEKERQDGGLKSFLFPWKLILPRFRVGREVVKRARARYMMKLFAMVEAKINKICRLSNLKWQQQSHQRV